LHINIDTPRNDATTVKQEGNRRVNAIFLLRNNHISHLYLSMQQVKDVQKIFSHEIFLLHAIASMQPFTTPVALQRA